MKAGLIFVGIWSLCLLLLSLFIVGAFDPLHARSFYPFTLPFITLAALCVVIAVVGLVAKRARAVAFWISTPLHGLLFFPYRFAMIQWPGGDDGGGMAWMYLIGWGSYIASLLAVIIILIAVILMAKGKKTRDGR
jgi:hypothetical protein